MVFHLYLSGFSPKRMALSSFLTLAITPLSLISPILCSLPNISYLVLATTLYLVRSLPILAAYYAYNTLISLYNSAGASSGASSGASYKPNYT